MKKELEIVLGDSPIDLICIQYIIEICSVCTKEIEIHKAKIKLHAIDRHYKWV
jgi:hypothetical protein